MGELMHDALGVGLAATQLGVLHRVLVYSRPARRPAHALVNPAIEWSGEELEAIEEGCLSLPGVHVEVERPVTLRVSARTRTASRSSSRRAGCEARVIQHEIDHLDGVLILDRVPREQRKEAMRAMREAEAALGPAALSSPMRTVFLGTSDVRGRRAARASPAAPIARRSCVTRPDRPSGRGRRLAPPPVADGRRASSASSSTSPRTSTPRPRASGSPRRNPRPSGRVRLRRAASGSRCSPSTSCSTCTRRCCRAGAARRRSSARSWPATSETGVVDHARHRRPGQRAGVPGRREPIAPEDTYGSLSARLQRLGGELLVGARSTERPPFAEQDEQGVTYAEKIAAADRLLDGTAARAASSSASCARCTRTSARAWRCLTAPLLGVRSAAVAADVAPAARGRAVAGRRRLLLSADPGALELLEVQPPGGRAMAAATTCAATLPAEGAARADSAAIS